MGDQSRHFERVFADPPTESDILGHPIDGGRNHRLLKVAGLVVIAVCAAATIGTVAFVAFALGVF